ncbi:MAG: hypothetical protein JO372_13640 [Solirubrobacterales bacterium]|nr:hypothetical protein [Solirubrobacterales bacterium]
MLSALGDPSHRVAPLRCALNISYPLASEDQEAPRPPTLGGSTQLTGDPRERDLVQVAHPIRNIPEIDGAQAAHGASHQLEVAVAMTAAELDRTLAGSAVPLTLIAEHVPGANADPSRLAAVLMPLEQALRPIEPRTGNRTVAPQHPQIGSHEGGDPRRGRLAPLGHVQPVRHLASRQRPVHLTEPAQGTRQAVIGLRPGQSRDRLLKKRAPLLEATVVNGDPARF